VQALLRGGGERRTKYFLFDALHMNNGDIRSTLMRRGGLFWHILEYKWIIEYFLDKGLIIFF
jgi:ATP-dependent DNA ligase